MTIPKGAGLPLAFAGAGLGYFVVTYFTGPPAEIYARQAWERHLRDAKIAAAFGVAAGAVLWLARGPSAQPRHSWH